MAAWNVAHDDDFSFEDSERFEEDSQASYDDSNDGINQNWRGWTSCPSSGEAIQPGLSCVVYQYQYPSSGRFSSASTNTVVQQQQQQQRNSRNEGAINGVLSLAEIAARMCAEKWSFQQLEEMYHFICETRMKRGVAPPSTIPEKIFLSFIVHCFPQSTDEIRMYSTLANGTCEQFNIGNSLYQIGSVRDVSQTGFLLSANVSSGSEAGCSQKSANQINSNCNNREPDSYHVTVKVDRCRIVECTCECSSRSSWCQHVVALSLYRIHQRHSIKFNETIADAINSMSDFELRKLVKWHINEIPRKCIPGFQRLIDQIKDPSSEINRIHGAPDPTDGGHEPVSRFDFPEIEDKIRRLLCKYCVPAPTVHCDVQYLSTTQHPTTVEWNSLIKPLRAREPEGMWNLLQMVREMFAKGDENSVALLRTITDECLSNTQVLLWWYITKLVQSGYWIQQTNGKMPAATQMLAQYNCAWMCDEVVTLWKCVAINPRASKYYRSQLATYLQDYHRTAVNRLKMVIGGVPTGEDPGPRADATVLSNHQTVLVLQSVINAEDNQQLSSQNMRFTVDWFPGFYPALQMCNYLCEKSINFGVPTDAYFDVAAPNLTKTVKMMAPKVKKNKKKKRRRNRRSGRNARNEVEEDEDEEQEEEIYDEINGIWRVVIDVRPERNRLDQHPQHHQNQNQNHQESTESGQESDVQPTTSKTGSDQLRGQQKMDSIEMEVNEVLAAAFTPLDAIESRFLKCEAYATHGYRLDAVDQAMKLIDYLLDSLKEQSEGLQPGKEEMTSSNKFSSPSSQWQDEKDVTGCSTDSERGCGGNSSMITMADYYHEVEKSNKFLTTLEKILYTSKVLRTTTHLHLKVFWMTLKALTVTKYPLATKHQQMLLFYIEAEFVAILQQLTITITLGSIEMEQVRSVAKHLVASNAGNNGDVPPIALAQFLFETLHSAAGASADELQPTSSPSTSSMSKKTQRIDDDELALQTALNLLGSFPAFTDSQYPMHCEAIRRQKNELALMLLTRFKESHEKLALIMDKILDPSLHRMYTNHASNAAYFLERCPIYLKYHKNRQRPCYPYQCEQPSTTMTTIGEMQTQKLKTVDQKLENELKLLKLDGEGTSTAAIVNRERISDEGVQSSSSSSETSSEVQPPTSLSTYGLTNHNVMTLLQQQQQQQQQQHQHPLQQQNQNQKNGGGGTRGQWVGKDVMLMKRKIKRRFVHQQNPVCSATEAHVYHMHELARKVLAEAGGQHNNMFAVGNAIIGSTHRKLHLCAVIIAVYAMGMNNRISPSWNTRTYSTSASWITGQVQDIGSSAVEMIRETWTSHFTPSEIAVISDRASLSSDPMMRKEAARLALSVLPYAHSLTDEEVISALEKCRNDSREMLIQGLTVMDTSQFRLLPRTKPLFIGMQHWLELCAEEEAQQQYPMHQQYQKHQQMVANPYANLRLMAPTYQHQSASTSQHQHQQHQHQQQYQQHQLQHQRQYQHQQQPHLQYSAAPPPAMMYAPPTMMAQQQYLYPSANGSIIDQSRLHQSHSAPQLGGVNDGLDCVNENGQIQQQQHQQQHQQMISSMVSPILINAFKCGIRALDCMATTPGEERQMFLKFGRSPPYYDEIMKLYHLSSQLGVQYVLLFFNTAARAIISPYVLHKFASESTNFFPYRPYCQGGLQGASSSSIAAVTASTSSTSALASSSSSSSSATPTTGAVSNQQPMPLMQSSLFSSNAPPINYRYPGVKFSSPGMISGLFVQNGFHHITGELFERTCEQYLQAIVNKLNNPRLSDANEVCLFISHAYEAFKCIPTPLGRNLFDDFVRTFKKQKAFKKDVAIVINNLLNQLC